MFYCVKINPCQDQEGRSREKMQNIITVASFLMALLNYLPFKICTLETYFPKIYVVPYGNVITFYNNSSGTKSREAGFSRQDQEISVKGHKLN